MLPTVVDRCHRFDFGRPTVEQVAKVLQPRRRHRSRSTSSRARVALIARHATGSFRDALGTLEQLVTYAGDEQIASADVLAVLGVADAEQLFEARRRDRRPRSGRRRCGARPQLAASGRDPGQVLRDLEVHGRELLAVQVLERGARRSSASPPSATRGCCEQAQALAGTDAVRLLDLVVRRARGDRQRRPGADPARARADQGRGARGRPVDRGAAGADRAARGRRPAAPAPGGGRRRGGRARAAEPRAGSPAPPTSQQPGAADAPRPAPPPQAAPEPPTPRRRRSQPAPRAARAAADPSSSRPSPPVAGRRRPRPQGQRDAGRAARRRPPGGGQRPGADARLPAGAAFLKRKAEQDDYRRAAAEALRRSPGRALALRYELRDDEDRHDRAGTPTLSGRGARATLHGGVRRRGSARRRRRGPRH